MRKNQGKDGGVDQKREGWGDESML